MSEDSPRPRLLAIVVSVALAGCSAGPAGPGDGGGTSGADAGATVARAETTGTIGAAGGTLVLEGATLRVDGGSLGADVMITLRRLSTAETPGAGQLVSAAYELLPAGLTFSELAMLELPLFGPAEGYGLAKWVDGGWAFVDGTGLPTSVPPAQSSGQLNGRTLSAPIAGFSRYAVVGRPTSETAPCACAQGATCDDGMCIELGCLRGMLGCPTGARVDVWSTRFFHVGCDGQRFNTACSLSNVLAPAVVEVNGFTIDRDEVTVQRYVNAGCPGIDRDAGVACPPDRRAQLLCTIDGNQVPCPCNATCPAGAATP